MEQELNKIIIQLHEKASHLNKLSTNDEALYEYINLNKPNLKEVLETYKPINEFKPVNTLRFLIANELEKGNLINHNKIKELKQALENRDVSSYYQLDDEVNKNLINYKRSKKGMFPNWKHVYKILFPFVFNTSDNTETKLLLQQIGEEIIKANQLENTTIHPVTFQGSQNYGSDRVWLAVIPESAPSVQYAYQMFFTIDINGIAGGIHKGHNLTQKEFDNQDLKFSNFNDYLSHTNSIKNEWTHLNSEVNFIFLEDRNKLRKIIKKMSLDTLNTYFSLLDKLVNDLHIQDEENVVFSVQKNELSFQVGKRYCFNTNKNNFDFISYEEIENSSLERELFSGKDIAYFYKKASSIETQLNYDKIKEAIETEFERDNHTLAKPYDNSAFRKCVFNPNFRVELFNFNSNLTMKGIKNEFINWLTLNPKTNYFNNDREALSKYLDTYNSYFGIDIFDVSNSNFELIINVIDKEIYQNENSKFLKYSEGESSHRPRAILGKSNYFKFLKNKFNNQFSISDDLNKPPLNQILFGPPGTGKTYETIKKAVEIINPNFSNSNNRESIKKEYDRLIEKGLIVFTTFHQSMSYEDFIEGIKPEVNEKDEITYTVKDGVFKELCKKASKRNSTIKSSNFDERFQKLKDEWEESDNSELVIEMTKSEFTITKISNSNILFNKKSGSNKHDLVISTLKDLYEEKRIMKSGLASYYYPIIDKLKSYEIESKNNDVNNFVLIIDEINRGNVSAIFGELITLIENTKRSGDGNPEALTAKLPYSKEDFTIPNNLYIIGTMNTADRSVEVLDTALRRRFHFEEKMPNYELPELKTDLSINLRTLLKTINKRIEILLDREHQIGHSYLLNIKKEEQLINAFQNKIIPLLQEYFYNDYDKVGLVLGKEFISKNTPKNIFADYKLDYKNDLLKDIYTWSELSKSNVVEKVKSIYTTENTNG